MILQLLPHLICRQQVSLWRTRCLPGAAPCRKKKTQPISARNPFSPRLVKQLIDSSSCGAKVNTESAPTVCAGWKTLKLGWMEFYWTVPVNAALSPQKSCEEEDGKAPACKTASDLPGEHKTAYVRYRSGIRFDTKERSILKSVSMKIYFVKPTQKLFFFLKRRHQCFKKIYNCSFLALDNQIKPKQKERSLSGNERCADWTFSKVDLTFQPHVFRIESNKSRLVHVAGKVLSQGFWVCGRKCQHLFVDGQSWEDPA